MRGVACALVLAALIPSPATAAEPALLARARTLYNAADYDAAIAAAEEARQAPSSADAASLVLARAHLERYRQRADPQDLSAAREALRAVKSNALGARDRVDLLVGLGQSLFLGEAFGAAAELFDTALIQGSALPPRARMLLLDWWASALDREAQTRPLDRRPPVFERIVERMEDELRVDPGCAPASYWLAAASRGTGDLDRAWDAAIAGWVRATLSPDTAASVRADLDRLVTQALIPERARHHGGSTEALRGEWDLVKTQWR
jgi:hypothetical protein